MCTRHINKNIFDLMMLLDDFVYLMKRLSDDKNDNRDNSDNTNSFNNSNHNGKMSTILVVHT